MELNKKIKLLAFDLDGTVLHNDKTLSPRFKTVIAKLIEKKIILVPITGRPFYLLPEEITAYKEYIEIAALANGADIRNLKTGKILHSNYIHKSNALEIEEYIEAQNIPIMFHTTHGMFLTEKTVKNGIKLTESDAVFSYMFNNFTLKRGQQIKNLSVMYDTPDFEVVKIDLPKLLPNQIKLIEEIFSEKEYTYVWASDHSIEITMKGASKGNGLKFACEHYGISLENAMAMGDTGNDVPMLEAAGFSVAMGNALDFVKEAADVVTDTNENDGAAIAIEKYVLA